jgi:predicted outer membrane repeat protein
MSDYGDWWCRPSWGGALVVNRERVMGMTGARLALGQTGGWRAGTAGTAAAVLVAGCLLSGGPAAAASVLYAAAAGTGTRSCASPADACSLAKALGKVAAGGTVQLVTPGATAHYVGNWTVSTTGTSARHPVTIRRAPGLRSAPVLDGNHGSATGCQTARCAGPVLTVPAGVFVDITGVTITHANDTSTGLDGGGIDVQGSVSVAASTFTGNTASDGAAILSGIGSGSTGSVSVSASTFTGNTATSDGGAIDGSDDGGTGPVSVSASTFSGNTAGVDGGAIDVADNGGGGALSVVASTFTGNTASAFGAIIDNGSDGGAGSVSVAADVFSGGCDWLDGTWVDAGHNAGLLTSGCYGRSPSSSDVLVKTPAALKLGKLAHHGGPTKTIKPEPGSPVIGIIPDPTTVTLNGARVQLCPTVDQRGESSAPHTSCDAGAVQTSANSHARGRS